VDVLEAIRRRRAHRSFSGEALPEDVLERLVWAAGRAPMGGNELVRRIVVVTDPPLVETIRQVTPSFIAEGAPCVIVVCTDLERAEASMGTQGRDILSLVDSGASAENVALAAQSFGLGVCFIRSANESAIRAVLDLPATWRVDVLVAVGRPAPTPSPAFKAPPPIVYRDRYGEAWPTSR
jgi:nitroreductase